MKKGNKNVAAGSAPLARNAVTGVMLHSAHGGPEKMDSGSQGRAGRQQEEKARDPVDQPRFPANSQQGERPLVTVPRR